MALPLGDAPYLDASSTHRSHYTTVISSCSYQQSVLHRRRYIPVLLATLRRLNVAEILDRHFPSGHRWKGELTFGGACRKSCVRVRERCMPDHLERFKGKRPSKRMAKWLRACFQPLIGSVHFLAASAMAR